MFAVSIHKVLPDCHDPGVGEIKRSGQYIQVKSIAALKSAPISQEPLLRQSVVSCDVSLQKSQRLHIKQATAAVWNNVLELGSSFLVH
jgi:hypothetical protein